MNLPRLIILAAGQGTRLRPLTDSRPKCMVEIHGKPLIQWQVETARAVGIQDITIVSGYRADSISVEGVRYVQNPRYAETNMVRTLFCAEFHFGDPLIVSYGDILYEPKALKQLMDSNHPVGVIVDTEWLSYWESRFENVLEDAETLRLDDAGAIVDIGQKPKTIEEISGQYIGLMKFSGDGLKQLCDAYTSELSAYERGESHICKERNLDQLYMTDLLQGLIDLGNTVSAVPISGGWVEIDFPQDLTLAQKYIDPSDVPLKISRSYATGD